MSVLNEGIGRCQGTARLLVRPVRAAIELGAAGDVLEATLRAVHHANRHGSREDFIAVALPTLRMGWETMLPGNELELIGSEASLKALLALEGIITLKRRGMLEETAIDGVFGEPGMIGAAYIRDRACEKHTPGWIRRNQARAERRGKPLGKPVAPRSHGRQALVLHHGAAVLHVREQVGAFTDAPLMVSTYGFSNSSAPAILPVDPESTRGREPSMTAGPPAGHELSSEPPVPVSEQTGAAAVGIAALFHDLGKATNLFQAKLRRALKGKEPEADAIRHELFSAVVWDRLFGETSDDALPAALTAVRPEQLDRACQEVRETLKALHTKPRKELGFRFLGDEGRLSHLIGMLILTHHRLPSADRGHLLFLAKGHVRAENPLNRDADLAIAPGTPFWHEGWWLDALRQEAARLRPGVLPASGDIALRASLMLADHMGSAFKSPNRAGVDYLANTTRTEGAKRPVPADSLSLHIKRVYRYARFSHQMTHSLRDRYPALDETALPGKIACPEPSRDNRFSWQAEAARSARTMCERHEGGFFAAIMAGTGTGKTRGAPTILANAAMGDVRPERRYLRMCLGLGLRVLASQSAKEYVQDLGFRDEDVSVLIGDPPLQFPEEPDVEAGQGEEGSESLMSLPEWLRVEQAAGAVPQEGEPCGENWLRALSLDADRGLPAFLERVLDPHPKARGTGKERRSTDGHRLLQAPIMVGTIDHLMGVAAPVDSRFLLQSLRLMTSDLILDEIDQFDGEDLAAIGRLVFQAGAVGRRVIIMSATLTPDVVEALHRAYSLGWRDYAGAHALSPRVNLLLCGDTPGSIVTNSNGEGISDLLENCRRSILAGLRTASPLRRGEILPPCDSWTELVAQIDQGCRRMHDLNAVEIQGHRVSVGMVRMTRISHTAALAVQMPSGNLGDRLRVMVCLHSQMPRMHRGFIETRLKRALTRKSPDPEAGLRSLCHTERLFERAAAVGVREIEIVVVTSPVIGTGDDLDFDYAILDPISTRSIIQPAGRVRRHRPAEGEHPNVLILGRSPVAMQEGALCWPGVETSPSCDTLVSPVEQLDIFEGRKFRELAGEVDFKIINAAPLLSDEEAFPLRDAEAALRMQMISTAERDPLGRYLLHPNARWNLQMTRTRRFRRSETREILYCKMGDDLQSSEWFINLNPGTRSSAFRQAGPEELYLPTGCFAVDALFEDLTASAWADYSQGLKDMAASDISSLLRVSVSSYGDDLKPVMTYNEFTGLTRGKPDDLFQEFGKTVRKQ